MEKVYPNKNLNATKPYVSPQKQRSIVVYAALGAIALSGILGNMGCREHKYEMLDLKEFERRILARDANDPNYESKRWDKAIERMVSDAVKNK